MSTSETAPDSNSWELVGRFTDGSGGVIGCGKPDCSLGSYALAEETTIDGDRPITTRQTSPACTTCRFAGALANVFNDVEECFVPGAPDEFKVGAAKVLTASGLPMAAIRQGRPETAAMIDEYAKK